MIGEFSDLVVPDVPAPIRGWRVFNIIPNPPDGRRLRALNAQGDWSVGGVATASCWNGGIAGRATCATSPSNPSLKSSHGGDGCGLYAVKELLSIVAEFGLPYFEFGHIRVWAEVELWGNVYEHEHGYRGQFGRVASLITVDGYGPTPEDVLEMLGEEADIGVMPLDDEMREVLKIREARHGFVRVLLDGT